MWLDFLQRKWTGPCIASSLSIQPMDFAILPWVPSWNDRSMPLPRHKCKCWEAPNKYIGPSAVWRRCPSCRNGGENSAFILSIYQIWMVLKVGLQFRVAFAGGGGKLVKCVKLVSNSWLWQHVFGSIYLDHIVHVYVGQCSIDFASHMEFSWEKLSFLELVLCCSVFGFFLLHGNPGCAHQS